MKSDFLEAMKEFKIVDQHEHLRNVLFENRLLEIDLPFFIARGYVRGDLVSAGLPDSFYELSTVYQNIPNVFSYLLEGGDSSEKLWNKLSPHLSKVKNTIYYQYLLKALKDLYGFEREEFGDDWKELSANIRAKSKTNPEWTLKILRQLDIHKVILDISGTSPPNKNIVKDDTLTQVVRMDGFITGDMDEVKNFRKEPIVDLDDYLNTLDEAFKTSVKEGVIGIKSGLAYQRRIEYRETPKYKADKILTSGLENTNSSGKKVFEDFMMHEVCKRCAEYELPFQIHTGIQAGNYNTIVNANPTHLTNLLRKYPTVKFDIFHGGYPYFREAGLLAKYFPNAYIDGCWLTHISTLAYKQAIDEWLEIVPAVKIFAWGGDHFIPEHTHSSLILAKELIAEVLTKKVKNKKLSKKTALWTAERILGKNAIEVYRL